ncbi:MAG: cupin domain-containing protein [Hyphomicrobium sp.]
MTVVPPERMLVELEDDEVCGPRHTHWISEPGYLTQFGAFVQVLPPGSRSSIKHWHSAEDELVYMLEGEVTLIEADTETTLRAGDAATFAAGVELGHQLENRCGTAARYLVVETRAPVDRIVCPDHDRVCHRDRALPDDIWTDSAGNPASNPYRGKS